LFLTTVLFLLGCRAWRLVKEYWQYGGTKVLRIAVNCLPIDMK
jgi:hypothetical protein